MNKKVRCPKCRQTYWEGAAHACPDPPQKRGWRDPTDDGGCMLDAGCCLAELLSSGCWWWVVLVSLLALMFVRLV